MAEQDFLSALSPVPHARLPDWPERLLAHVAACETLPFAWGRHDCVTFAAGAVQAVTGWAGWPAAPWADERAALRRVHRWGGWQAAVHAVLGAPRAHVLAARRGDVLLLQVAGAGRWTQALGVCVGDKALAAAPSGLARVPLHRAVCAWAVG